MSAPQLYVGLELPPLECAPDLRQIVQYAGASGDFYEMHYDLDFARALCHPELAVHGLMKAALLGRVVERWLGGRGRVTSLGARYVGMDFRGEPFTCRARVETLDGAHVHLSTWTENVRGEITTTGHADVELSGA